MGSIYSFQFLTAFESAGANDYTVPEGYTAVVRDISGYLGFTATPNRLWFSCFGCRFYYADNTLADLAESFHWEGRMVCPPGGTIEASVQQGAADYVVSGYLLEGIFSP